MKQFVVLMFVGLIGLLVGCSGEETRTVDWYLQPENKVAWEEKLKECNNNPGELNNTPNCQNARKAADKQFLEGTFEKVREPTYGF